MRLVFTEIRAAYRVVAPLRLPEHTGSLFRGVLGRALRRAACLSAEPCGAACLQPGECAYARLFDPPAPDPGAHRFLRGVTRAPQPLIPIFPAPGARVLQPGDSLVLGARVLGELAPADLGRLQAAMELIADFPLGDTERALEVEGITQVGPRRRTIDVHPGEPRDGRVRIRAETPLWIERDDVLVAPADFDLGLLFRSAHRRLTTLAALHGTLEPDDERAFAELSTRAAEVRTVERQLRPLRWERWSEEKQQHQPVRGLLGDVVIEGPIGLFLPVLRAAALVHVGKGTSQGLGRIVLEELDPPRR